MASLTDHQIVERYVLPAVARGEERERELRESRGEPAASPSAAPPRTRPDRRKAADPEPGSPEHRRAVIDLGFCGTMGMPREAAERLYERQLGEWRASQETR